MTRARHQDCSEALTVGEYCGDVGEYCGEVGLYAGDLCRKEGELIN